MQHQSPQLQSCIQECLKCYSICLGMLTSHCLQAGGKHLEAEHVHLMMACAEMCRTSAAMMLIGTEHHKHTCRECAEICEACAKSCEQVGDMDECARQCRACTESCRQMAA